MFENGYMRGRLDNVINNQSVLYNYMLSDLFLSVVQQRLKEPLRFDIIDQREFSWISLYEIARVLFTPSCTMHKIILCAMDELEKSC